MKRKTIGLFIDQLVYEYQADLWHGMCAEAEKRNLNLITFVGSTMSNVDKNYISLNKAYMLRSQKRLDGAIALISSLASLISQSDKINFLNQLQAICPTVVIGDVISGFPSIAVDNRKGMFDSVVHLINSHNKKRIAFIGGPSSSAEATERFDAYKDALAESNIKYDKTLYCEARFDFASGQEAIDHLISNKIDFDAVVAASDWMAFGALQQLKKNNIAVPEEVALSGFDNVEATYVSAPPLATVRQPLLQMGEKAVELLSDILQNRKYEEQVIFPTEFLSRNSCGCLLSENNQINDDLKVYNLEKVDLSKTAQKYSNFLNELIEKLTFDVNNPGKDKFLKFFNAELEHITSSDDISDFHTILADLRNNFSSPQLISEHQTDQVKSLLKKSYVKMQKFEGILNQFCSFNKNIESYFHRASLLVARKGEQIQFIKHLDSNNKNSDIIRIGQKLLTSYTKRGLFDAIVNDFPVIDITSCSIVEYVKPQIAMVQEQAQVMFNFNSQNKSESDEKVFDSSMILPDKFWPEEGDKAWRMVVSSMVNDGKPLGYVVYKSYSTFGQIFETFSSEIASALRGIMIYEEGKKVAALVQKQNSTITKLILPMLKSILEIANVSENEVEAIQKLSGMTDSGLMHLKESSIIIEKASVSINQMLPMIDLIDDISANINILALNASIESARAGTYGYGFQVIAEEIKQLSDTTAKNTKSISEALKRVVLNISESNEASKDNFIVFQSVKNQVNKVTGFLIDVTEKMNELSVGSNEILIEIKKEIT